jgi:sugar phosphate permease
MQGVGASTSSLAAGLLMDRFGYSLTFLSLGAVAAVALAVLALAMPETAPGP